MEKKSPSPPPHNGSLCAYWKDRFSQKKVSPKKLSPKSFSPKSYRQNNSRQKSPFRVLGPEPPYRSCGNPTPTSSRWLLGGLPTHPPHKWWVGFSDGSGARSSLPHIRGFVVGWRWGLPSHPKEGGEGWKGSGARPPWLGWEGSESLPAQAAHRRVGVGFGMGRVPAPPYLRWRVTGGHPTHPAHNRVGFGMSPGPRRPHFRRGVSRCLSTHPAHRGVGGSWYMSESRSSLRQVGGFW